jgi:DNA-binding response OmpR family regulator
MGKKSILVIEDEKNLQDAIKSILDESGFQVFVSASVDDGVSIFKKNKIDLIWLDHYLFGEKDGLDFFQAVKNDLKKSNPPIILVSNTCSLEKYHDYVSLGITKYFVKTENSLQSIVSEINALI